MLKALFACAGLIATAALAQAPDNSRTTKRGPSGDPNQIVCVTQSEIGSRLNRRRVCRTRAEWAEHQNEYKQEIERAQRELQSSFADPG